MDWKREVQRQHNCLLLLMEQTWKVKSLSDNKAVIESGRGNVTRTHTHTNLCCAAHALWSLAGSHQQQVAMLVGLIVNRAGQADFTCLCWDGEETARIDKETVADWFLLKGHSRCGQEPGETWSKKLLD